MEKELKSITPVEIIQESYDGFSDDETQYLGQLLGDMFDLLDLYEETLDPLYDKAAQRVALHLNMEFENITGEPFIAWEELGDY